MLKTERLGEVNPIQNTKIIAYRNSRDIDVLFPDGDIAYHQQYRFFVAGKITHPKENKQIKTHRIGEVVVNIYGETMELIDYISCSDVTVKIDDEIIKHKEYRYFKDGSLHSSKIDPWEAKNKDRVGERYTFDDGTYMEIIAMRNTQDVDVKFSDGTMAKHKGYWNFVKGNISHPNKKELVAKEKIGQIKVNKQGYEMKIVKYTSYRDCDVCFTIDNTVVEHTLYQNFTSGKLSHPLYRKKISAEDAKNRVGLEQTTSQGLTAKIIRYGGSNDIDVLIKETNNIIKHRGYRDFLEGCIFDDKYRFTQTFQTKCGLSAKVSQYNSTTDIDIEFEDGIIVNHKSMRSLTTGRCLHPGFHPQYKRKYKNCIQTKFAFADNDNVYYHCLCDACKKEDIWSAKEVVEHYKKCKGE